MTGMTSPAASGLLRFRAGLMRLGLGVQLVKKDIQLFAIDGTGRHYETVPLGHAWQIYYHIGQFAMVD